jgi:hypothetical protein
VLQGSTHCGVPLCAQIALLESTLLLVAPAFAWTVLQGPPVLLVLQHVLHVHHNFSGFFLQPRIMDGQALSLTILQLFPVQNSLQPTACFQFKFQTLVMTGFNVCSRMCMFPEYKTRSQATLVKIIVCICAALYVGTVEFTYTFQFFMSRNNYLPNMSPIFKHLD